MPTTSFIILVVVATIASLIFIKLASLPGATAKKKGHPQADAINVLGWVGLPLGIAPWLIALVWANMQPLSAKASPAAPTDGD